MSWFFRCPAGCFPALPPGREPAARNLAGIRHAVGVALRSFAVRGRRALDGSKAKIQGLGSSAIRATIRLRFGVGRQGFTLDRVKEPKGVARQWLRALFPVSCLWPRMSCLWLVNEFLSMVSSLTTPPAIDCGRRQDNACQKHNTRLQAKAHHVLGHGFAAGHVWSSARITRSGWQPAPAWLFGYLAGIIPRWMQSGITAVVIQSRRYRKGASQSLTIKIILIRPGE